MSSEILMIPPKGAETTTTVGGRTYTSAGDPVAIADWSDFRALGQYGWRRHDPDAKPASPAVMTPNRQRLTELIDERDGVSAELARLSESIKRLADAERAEAQPSAELAQLESVETAAMTAWSRSPGDKDAPTPDVEKRSHLERKLAAARASAASARNAQSGLNAEAATLAAKQGAIGKAINALVAEIVAEEALTPLLGELARADAALKTVRAQINMGRQFVLGRAEAQPALFHWVEDFDRRFSQLEQLPLDTPPVGAWSAFAQRLTSDPAAQL